MRKAGNQALIRGTLRPGPSSLLRRKVNFFEQLLLSRAWSVYRVFHNILNAILTRALCTPCEAQFELLIMDL